LVQRYGPEKLKRRLWNHEFATGHWVCLENTAGDCIYPHLEKWVRQGSILDLGCGPGNTGNELKDSAYRFYTGIDISDVAVEKARARSRANDRAQKNSYFQSDIYTYVPAKQYDVVLFGDSLYYIPPPKIAGMLHRYAAFLAKDGVFMARMYDMRGKFKIILDVIEENFEVLEKHVYDSQVCVIIFRAPAVAPAAAIGRRA
jgi:2-polyprenyl-6-hydroxyphenyl methylase/3-demethylubiquinone-9 3-methyltransferase